MKGWEELVDIKIENIVVSSYRNKQVIHVNYNTGKRFSYNENSDLPWSVVRVFLNVTPETKYVEGFNGDVTKVEVYRV